jgi:triacylglycerol lipase
MISLSTVSAINKKKSMATQPPYPLHESIRDLLDPEYASFYKQHLLHAPQVHHQPVAASRVGGKLIPVSLFLLPFQPANRSKGDIL